MPIQLGALAALGKLAAQIPAWRQSEQASATIKTCRQQAVIPINTNLYLNYAEVLPIVKLSDEL
jgi:hypothetical protein